MHTYLILKTKRPDRYTLPSYLPHRPNTTLTLLSAHILFSLFSVLSSLFSFLFALVNSFRYAAEPFPVKHSSLPCPPKGLAQGPRPAHAHVVVATATASATTENRLFLIHVADP